MFLYIIFPIYKNKNVAALKITPMLPQFKITVCFHQTTKRVVLIGKKTSTKFYETLSSLLENIKLTKALGYTLLCSHREPLP